MKSKHIFIYDDSVHENMIVRVVWVGISERDKRAASRVQLLAAKTPDAFWKKYDCDVCDFLHNLAMQLYPLLSPSGAFDKFFYQNMRQSSLQECEALMQSSIHPSNV